MVKFEMSKNALSNCETNFAFYSEEIFAIRYPSAMFIYNPLSKVRDKENKRVQMANIFGVGFLVIFWGYFLGGFWGVVSLGWFFRGFNGSFF